MGMNVVWLIVFFGLLLIAISSRPRTLVGWCEHCWHHCAEPSQYAGNGGGSCMRCCHCDKEGFGHDINKCSDVVLRLPADYWMKKYFLEKAGGNQASMEPAKATSASEAL